MKRPATMQRWLVIFIGLFEILKLRLDDPQAKSSLEHFPHHGGFGFLKFMLHMILHAYERIESCDLNVLKLITVTILLKMCLPSRAPLFWNEVKIVINIRMMLNISCQLLQLSSSNFWPFGISPMIKLVIIWAHRRVQFFMGGTVEHYIQVVFVLQHKIQFQNFFRLQITLDCAHFKVALNRYG